MAPTLRRCRFEVEPRSIQTDDETIGTAGIVWRGIAEGIGPSDVLGAPREREAPKLDAAEQLLLALLGDGPMVRSEIVKAADSEDVSWRTVMTAKAKLGVVSEQVHQPGKLGLLIGAFPI